MGKSRADRYTYLSQIGLDIALVWGAMRLGASWPARRWVFGIGSALILAALMACTWRQTGYWQDDKTLWERAIACDPKNPTAHEILGAALEDGDESAAAQHYRQAVEIGPNGRNIYQLIRAKAHNGLGTFAARKGDLFTAASHYEQALKFDPDLASTHMNLGGILAQQGNLAGAIYQFKRSIELDRKNASAYHNLATALAQQGKTDEAIKNCRRALEIDPELRPPGGSSSSYRSARLLKMGLAPNLRADFPAYQHPVRCLSQFFNITRSAALLSGRSVHGESTRRGPPRSVCYLPATLRLSAIGKR